MINIEYFNLNKFLLLHIGLWPYKQSHFTQFQFIFLSDILTTNVIFQMKVSLDQLLHVYNEINDKNEIAIMNECGYNSERYTAVLTILDVCNMFAIIIASTWSDILLTSWSKSCHLMIATEYFIDQEKYYYILIHFCTLNCTEAFAMLRTETIFIVYFAHIIGLFKIASCRIERAINIVMLQNINEKSTLMYEGLICTVNIHLQAMKLSSDSLCGFETIIFCLVVFTVGSLSFNLLRIFQIISSEENIEDLICPLLFVTFTIIYTFIANYIGQSIMNHNHGIFTTAYSVRWYVAPLYIQKMILFLLQRNSIVFALKTGGVFVASIQCFASMIKTSVSYFTVIPHSDEINIILIK
ncbi:uncharacterized protein [Anoplolepis gracilipes]|uniref:uncharacterized protein n=1 Tax=Anoplolepis gracilipes TaxID=354296 RepID=UPI003B9DDA59